MKRVTVADVTDDPVFGAELQRRLDAINRDADEWEFAYCQERGKPVSRALWKRMKKWRAR